MMSDRTFARRFSSYWRSLLPMGDYLIRRVNLEPTRYASAIVGRSAPERRALVNEAGFLLAELCAKNGAVEGRIRSYEYLDLLREVESRAVEKIAPLERRKAGDIAALDPLEASEASEMAISIIKFIQLSGSADDFEFSPIFYGCGMVSDCAGDLRVGAALCELKAGDRGFRSQDLRQIFVCLCLNYAKTTHSIDKLSVVNPRRGVKFQVDVDALCRAASGRAFFDVAGDLIKFMSEVSVSR